jgi:hypothetical protein
MKNTILLLLFAPLLCAATLQKTYTVEFGVFGKIGEATFTKESNSTHYHFTIHARPYGFAKRISQNHQEILESQGRILNKIYYPSRYTKTVLKADKRQITSYTFNHKKETIYKNNQTLHPFYVPNDLLSLYFNIHHPSYQNREHYFAIGGDKKEGKVLVIKADSQKKERLKSYFSHTMNNVLLVTLFQKFFVTQLGELTLNLDSNYLPKEIFLKDAIIFGDIYASQDIKN